MHILNVEERKIGYLIFSGLLLRSSIWRATWRSFSSKSLGNSSLEIDSTWGFEAICMATSAARAWNVSPRPTKSVSQFTSAKIPNLHTSQIWLVELALQPEYKGSTVIPWEAEQCLLHEKYSSFYLKLSLSSVSQVLCPLFLYFPTLGTLFSPENVCVENSWWVFSLAGSYCKHFGLISSTYFVLTKVLFLWRSLGVILTETLRWQLHLEPRNRSQWVKIFAELSLAVKLTPLKYTDLERRQVANNLACSFVHEGSLNGMV